MEAEQANNLDNFSAWFGEVLNSLCIDRMDGNEEIFARVMGDKAFRTGYKSILRKRYMAHIRSRNMVYE